MRLRDKVIIVTGSTTGIGEAIARRVASEGARVMITGRDAVRGQAVLADLLKAYPGQASLFIDELSHPDMPRRLVDATLSAFGRLDAVANNAAWVVRSNLENTDAAMFDKVMAVNVRAPLLLIQAAAPHLKLTKGCVLNIGSVNAYCGEANLLAYSISKGALMTLSRNLADALGRDNVRVNHFNVGWVLTPNEYQYKLADGLPANWPEQIDRTTAPWGRIMKPEEIAEASIYWLGDESRPISGSIIDLEQYPIIGRNPTKEVK